MNAVSAPLRIAYMISWKCWVTVSCISLMARFDLASSTGMASIAWNLSASLLSKRRKRLSTERTVGEELAQEAISCYFEKMMVA